MKHTVWSLLILAGLAILAGGARAGAAASPPAIQDRGTQISFPNRLTFAAHIASSVPLARVVLEYGVDQLTCGQVTAKGFPAVAPGTTVDVTWTWDMHKSGSEPPGARIWYRWRATGTDGQESVSDTYHVTWLDSGHPWQSVNRELLTLHWYNGSRSFALDLLNSAVDSLHRLEQTTGVAATAPIDLYIYGTEQDLHDAILYQPGWTGGEAFPEYDSVSIGISPADIAWGKRTEAHELTHVLVGHLTFSCLTSVPTWLNEGIAVYGEGGIEPASQDQLQQAIQANALISVRALSGGFSEHPNKADLSYSESYSLVNYLVSRFGAANMRKLFADERVGLPIDAALNDTYGFGLDGLEDRWRAAAGAPPRQDAGAPAPATAVPTAVPTYPPIAGAPRASAPGLTPGPSQTPGEPPAGAPTPTLALEIPPVAAGTGLNPILIVGAAGTLAGLTGLALWTRRRRSV